MGKKEITWLELIKKKINETKSKGENVSMLNILPEAKKEWLLIKDGMHEEFIQGKNKSNNKSKKVKNKSKKVKNKSKNIKDIIKECKLCDKCMKELKNYINK